MKVTRNYSQNYVGIQPTKKRQQTFTGAPVAKSGDFVSRLKQAGLAKFMQKLEWFDGEKGRIVMTAVGTGMIAPLFIAWNPYVKPKKDATEEEKADLKRTQKYTAMRQPISAALAIPIQLTLLGPLEKGIDTLFNNPKYSKYLPAYIDKSALQDDKYIARNEEKKLKGAKLSKKELETKLNANVKSVKDAQVANVADTLLETGQIRIREGGEGLVDNKSVVQALKDKIKSYAQDANFLRYDSLTDEQLKELFNNPEISLEELLGKKPADKNKNLTDAKDFYTKRAETLVNNKAELTKVLQEDLPKENITGYLQKQLEKTQDKELKKIYQEIINLGETSSQTSRASRTIERIGKIERLCDNNFTPEKYRALMENRDSELLRRLKEFAKISKGIEENPDSIKSSISKLAENCKFDPTDKKVLSIFNELETFGVHAEKLKQKICKDIVKTYKDMMGKRYRLFKEIAGISLGIFVTIPITCHALNWVYPRFMEIFFPKLTGNKKAAEKTGGEK